MLSIIHRDSVVAVLAPAGRPDEAPYRAGLEILAERYRLLTGPESLSPAGDDLPHLAGPDLERARRFNEALADPRVEAIFCARGGYGSMRLLPLLDADKMSRRRLAVVGFSDVTAIHGWLSGLGVPSVHGPVVTQLPSLAAEDREALFALLEGRSLPNLSGLRTLRPGRASGTLRGGNLSLLAHLCGTPYFPDLRGAILLLEEVGEPPYRIDRMLTQLMLSGHLARAAGIVVGSIERCDGTAALAVLADRLGDLPLPVALGAPIGHGGRNIAVPLGLPAHLDAGAGTLKLAWG